MTTVALIVAAGRGSRAGGDLPKQYAEIGGKAVLAHTIEAFSANPAVDAVQVVIHPEDEEIYRTRCAAVSAKVREPVSGGATRQASVLAGLEALLSIGPARVLIHDGARPFVGAETIGRVLSALGLEQGAIAAVPLADTLKRAGAALMIAGTLDRSGLWRAQTPQGFPYAAILKAHRDAAVAGLSDFTDDAAIAEWAGLPVKLVEGSNENVKLTTAEDIAAADRRLASSMTALEPRTGSGFDVHRFVDGDHVWLCGVRIPHTHRLEGHSDADAALHALTDALLGALGEGDIGEHFPPSDARWKGAASRLFLEDAARRVASRHGRIVNVDVTILAEVPRIGPFREAMRHAVAGILGIDPGRVGVKATTTEGLGFPGRREGLAALASATILLPA